MAATMSCLSGLPTQAAPADSAALIRGSISERQPADAVLQYLALKGQAQKALEVKAEVKAELKAKQKRR